MNERIRELFNKASAYAYEQNPGENSYGRPVDENRYEEDRYTKFAELIVRECIQVAMDEIVSDEDINNTKAIEDLYYLHGNNSGVEYAVVSIKQHFGVEE